MQQRPTFLQTAMQMAPVVTVTIGINLVVFLLWQLAPGSRGVAEVMVGNFLTSWDLLISGRAWTILTSAYSHMDLMHLLVNMFMLWSFGIGLERVWGRQRFLTLYLVCAVAGSLAHCVTVAWLLDMPGRGALGASGAVCGVVMASALQFPKSRVLVFGILPAPALAFVLVMVGFDIWGLINQTRGHVVGIGHAAHLGGGLAGALIFRAYTRPRR